MFNTVSKNVCIQSCRLSWWVFSKFILLPTQLLLKHCRVMSMYRCIQMTLLCQFWFKQRSCNWDNFNLIIVLFQFFVFFLYSRRSIMVYWKIHLWKFTYIYTDPPLTLKIKRVKRQYPNYFSKLHTGSPCVSSSSACSTLHFPAFLTKIISLNFFLL